MITVKKTRYILREKGYYNGPSLWKLFGDILV